MIKKCTMGIRLRTCFCCCFWCKLHHIAAFRTVRTTVDQMGDRCVSTGNNARQAEMRIWEEYDLPIKQRITQMRFFFICRHCKLLLKMVISQYPIFQLLFFWYKLKTPTRVDRGKWTLPSYRVEKIELDSTQFKRQRP